MRDRYEKAQAFLANLSANSPELPFEPSLLPDLFEATSGSSTKTMDHIAALVERSQGLASRILRQANSAYYGIQTEVSSLGHAVRLLGLNEVRNIIVQLGVASAVKKLPLPPSFQFEKLWEHQLFTANIARSIARSVPHIAGPGNAVSPDELYAAGLLHDMFLYDWHTHGKETGNRFHGLTHPKVALENAEKEFHLNDVERDIILKHMWPLTPVPPLYRESYVVLYHDKICSTRETLGRPFL